MTIKEVSENYNISQDTLRYYERVGMIPHVTRSSSGHRDYQPEDLSWVELAKCLRSAGLTVEAIVDYVRLSQEGDGSILDRLELLKSQRQLLQNQQQRMSEAMSRLEKKISRYEELLSQSSN